MMLWCAALGEIEEIQLRIKALVEAESAEFDTLLALAEARHKKVMELCQSLLQEDRSNIPQTLIDVLNDWVLDGAVTESKLSQQLVEVRRKLSELNNGRRATNAYKGAV